MSAAPDAPTSTTARDRSPRRGVLATEARLFVREPGSLFWIVLFPAALLLVIGAVPAFREPNADLGGRTVLDLYATVVVLLTALFASVSTMPAVLCGYRERGVLRRLQATPVSPWVLLRAQVLLHVVAILAGSLLALAAGRLVWGVALPAHPVGWVLAYVLAVLSALAVGAAVTGTAPSVKVATTVGTITLFPLMFTAGVWFPVQAMSGLLQHVVLWTPLGAGARALDDAARGDWPQLVDLGVTGGWTVVLALLAVRTFRW